MSSVSVTRTGSAWPIAGLIDTANHVNAAPSGQEAATLPPARPSEETVAPPDGGFSTEPASLPSGTTPVDFPGYEILGELGRGGMGVVYKAGTRSWADWSRSR